MPRYEHRVYRVQVQWDGGDYYLAAMIQKQDWANVDHLGEQGWEFVAFVPNPEIHVKDSFPAGIVPFVQLAVFKREMKDDEEMGWGVTRAH